MPNIAVIGAQWGDEGKGKVVDLISDRFDVVARGSFFGEGRYTRKAPKGRFPLAVAFSLADGEDVADRVEPLFEEAGYAWNDEDYFLDIIDVLRPRAETLNDFAEQAGYFFDDDFPYEEDARKRSDPENNEDDNNSDIDDDPDDEELAGPGPQDLGDSSPGGSNPGSNGSDTAVEQEAMSEDEMENVDATEALPNRKPISQVTNPDQGPVPPEFSHQSLPG